tara:strand:- start:810 stop:1049 length:240 start_codon:yes stop_codon:yes gene_type:complete
VKQAKKNRRLWEPSQILDDIDFNGYTIKSLKHGNTGHVLYRFPSKAHNWENCWTTDLNTAKTNVGKYKLHLKSKEKKST